jgi:hypothetical protein
VGQLGRRLGEQGRQADRRFAESRRQLDLQPPPLSLDGREELRPGGFELIDAHPQPLNGVRMLETDPGGRQCRIHDERIHFPLGQFDDRKRAAVVRRQRNPAPIRSTGHRGDVVVDGYWRQQIDLRLQQPGAERVADPVHAADPGTSHHPPADVGTGLGAPDGVGDERDRDHRCAEVADVPSPRTVAHGGGVGSTLSVSPYT